MRAARVRQWICARGAVTTAGIRMSAITIFQRTPKRLAAALAMAGTLAAGVAGGYAARYAHLPLPWLLGALLTITALSLAGAPVRLIPWGRPAGTIVVGASTGLQSRLSIDAHHHRADLVPHRARPVPTRCGLDLRQAARRVPVTTKGFLVC
jgi:hypothetical protein